MQKRIKKWELIAIQAASMLAILFTVISFMSGLLTSLLIWIPLAIWLSYTNIHLSQGKSMNNIIRGVAVATSLLIFIGVTLSIIYAILSYK